MSTGTVSVDNSGITGELPGCQLIIGMLLAAAMVFLSMPAAAHAPTNITITYNPDMHKLSVAIIHPVDDPATHYLKSIVVRLNGAVISDHPYTSQPGRTTATYTYDVMANPGDSVWVTAKCVNGQSIEGHADIPRPVSPTLPAGTLSAVTTTTLPGTTTTLPQTRPTTYASPGLLPLIGALAAALLAIKRE